MGKFRKQEWWMIRHAPVRIPHIYGQQDVDADLADNPQFKTLTSVLPNKAYMLSSDLKRCLKTAQKIFPNTPVTCSPLFREQHFGDWQGLTYDQAKKSDMLVYDQFWQDPVRQAPPGGESFEDLVIRTIGAVKAVTDQSDQEVVILFAHAGTIRALLSEALNIPLERAINLSIDPLSHSKMTLFKSDCEENWHVDWINRNGR